MEVEKYLSRYHLMQIKLKKLEELHKEYIRMSFSTTSVQYDIEIVSMSKKLEAPFTKWIHKAMEIEDEINQIKKIIPELKNDILSIICSIEQPDYQRLLIYKYIDWLTWKEIAEKLCFSYSTIKRIHTKAIQQINDMNIIGNNNECH